MPDKTPPTQLQVTQLMSSIDVLTEDIDRLRSALAKANLRSKVMTFLALLVAVAVAMIGAAAYGNYKTVQAINRSRADRSMTACIYENRGIKADRDTAINGLRAVLPADLTDQQKAVIAAYTHAIEDGKPYRDCSKEGIAAYYSATPQDPALLDG